MEETTEFLGPRRQRRRHAAVHVLLPRLGQPRRAPLARDDPAPVELQVAAADDGRHGEEPLRASRPGISLDDLYVGLDRAVHGQEVRGRAAGVRARGHPRRRRRAHDDRVPRDGADAAARAGGHRRRREFDAPYAQVSGAGVLFGASGGVAEAALRMAVEKLTGEPRRDQLDFQAVRGFDGVKEATVDGRRHDGAGRRDLRPGQRRRRSSSGSLAGEDVGYDLVEVMACPGGCINGAGHPVPGPGGRDGRAPGAARRHRQGLEVPQVAGEPGHPPALRRVLRRAELRSSPTTCCTRRTRRSARLTRYPERSRPRSSRPRQRNARVADPPRSAPARRRSPDGVRRRAAPRPAPPPAPAATATAVASRARDRRPDDRPHRLPQGPDDHGPGRPDGRCREQGTAAEDYEVTMYGTPDEVVPLDRPGQRRRGARPREPRGRPLQRRPAHRRGRSRSRRSTRSACSRSSSPATPSTASPTSGAARSTRRARARRPSTSSTTC